MRKMCLYLTLVLAFLLGSREGFLTRWIPPEPDAVFTFPCRISSLPPADRKLLEEGIRVETRQELMGLLEDYLS